MATALVLTVVAAAMRRRRVLLGIPHGSVTFDGDGQRASLWLMLVD